MVLCNGRMIVGVDCWREKRIDLVMGRCLFEINFAHSLLLLDIGYSHKAIYFGHML